MKMHHLAIRIRDIEKSIKFYEDIVGLRIAKRIKTENAEVAYLKDPEQDMMLEVICMDGGDKYEGKGQFLCFATDAIEEVHKLAVEKGYQPTPIFRPEPDATYFYVYDPDGFSVQFREY